MWFFDRPFLIDPTYDISISIFLEMYLNSHLQKECPYARLLNFGETHMNIRMSSLWLFIYTISMSIILGPKRDNLLLKSLFCSPFQFLIETSQVRSVLGFIDVLEYQIVFSSNCLCLDVWVHVRTQPYVYI